MAALDGGIRISHLISGCSVNIFQPTWLCVVISSFPCSDNLFPRYVVYLWSRAESQHRNSSYQNNSDHLIRYCLPHLAAHISPGSDLIQWTQVVKWTLVVRCSNLTICHLNYNGIYVRKSQICMYDSWLNSFYTVNSIDTYSKDSYTFQIFTRPLQL